MTTYSQEGTCSYNEKFIDYLKKKSEMLSSYDFDKHNKSLEIKESTFENVDNVLEKLTQTHPNFKYIKDIQYSNANPATSWLELLKQIQLDLPRCCLLVINSTDMKRDVQKLDNFKNYFMALDLTNIDIEKNIREIIMCFNLLFNIFGIQELIRDDPESKRILKIILSSPKIIITPVNENKDASAIYNKINYTLSVLYFFAQQISVPISLFFTPITTKLASFSINFTNLNVYRIFDIASSQLITVSSYGLNYSYFLNLMIPTHHLFSRILISDKDVKYVPDVDMVIDYHIIPIDFILSETKSIPSLWFKSNFITEQIKTLKKISEIIVAFIYDSRRKNPLYGNSVNPLPPVRGNRSVDSAVRLSSRTSLTHQSLFTSPADRLFGSRPHTVSVGGRKLLRRTKKNRKLSKKHIRKLTRKYK